MDNLFLPREVGSIETGPQTFAETDILNTSFIFSSYPALSEGPGLLNSVLVQNAGLSILNGIFVYVTEFETKPYYYKEGSPNLFILWFANQWEIYNTNIDSVPIYYSFEDVLYPWNATTWIASDIIYEPTPSVTKIL